MAKKRVVIDGQDPIIDEILLFAILPFLRGKEKKKKK